MSTNSICHEMELLIQADIDGELRAAEAAAVLAHRSQCAHCEAVYRQLRDLRRNVRSELTRHAPSPDFRAMLEAKLAQQSQRTQPETVSNIARKKSRWPVFPAFGAGVALAASLIFFAFNPVQSNLVDAVVAEHVRAMQPGHLLDVASTDHHNVKPWFAGKLDFSPPVKNLAEQGYPLQGGRLDYLNGRSVAALVYTHGKHSINLFVCPEAGQKVKVDVATGLHRSDGYNVYHWKQDDMIFWAVSDLNQTELSEFVDQWKTMTF